MLLLKDLANLRLFSLHQMAVKRLPWMFSILKVCHKMLLDFALAKGIRLSAYLSM